MTQLRIAIIGLGKMGSAVREVAIAQEISVVAVIGPDTPINAESLSGADVAIEFTEPSAAIANAEACIAAGCPVVMGTTGWHARLQELSTFAHDHNGAILWASNFSLGVHLVARLVRVAGTLFSRVHGFDAHIVETHHTAKKDAPSGTAIMLQNAMEATLLEPVPITSVRVGSVPGTHEVILDGAYEQIVISHEARDRRVFAEGALVAARWLVGRRGVFTLDDVLSPEDAE